MTDEIKFPETERAAIVGALDAVGAPGILAFIRKFASIDERKALYGLARRVLQAQLPIDLDAVQAVAEAGIADISAEAEKIEDTAAANALKDAANVLSYNFSADMAPCWPKDDTKREKRHLEAGLAAAKNCLKWRHELQKGPWPFSVAYWAQGVHQLALGSYAEAIESFQHSYHHAELVAAGAGADADRDFGCLTALGYLGLAEEAAGNPAGAARYADVLKKFRAIASGEPGEAADDAAFGIAQLETMKSRL